MASWSTACPDWKERIVERRSLVPFAPLFPDEAEAALAVFKSLQVVDLAQKPDGTWPTLGESCEDWVFDFVRAIFGSYNARTAKRLIRRYLLLISKKNAKSTIAAGIMLTALIRNWRHQAELLILAPTIEVANNSFGPAKGMVEADPELSNLLQVITHQRTIKHRVTGAELKVVAADGDVVSGKKAAFVLVEELWLFGKRPAAKAMLREATGGLVSREEGFVVLLSTHSDEPPAGVFKEELDYFRDVRDGVIEDLTSFGVLYEWPEELIEAEAYLDPENFYVTNPNIGRSVSPEWLEAELVKERRGDGEGLQIFLAKHLNVEIGLRLRRDRWSAAELWTAAADPGLTIDTVLDRSEVVIVGIDGGGRDDLFGLTVLGRERGTGLWLSWSHGWVQAVALERRKAIAPLLKGFAADGDLTIVETGQELVQGVARLAARVRDSRKMPAVGGLAVDAWGMGPLVDALVEAGFDPGDESLKRAGHIYAVRQGVGLSSAIYTVEFKLGDGLLQHDGSEMMAWCVSNALVKLRGSAVYVDKETSGAGKIDPLVALLNAVKVMELGPVASVETVSPYAQRGLVVV